MNGQAGYVLLTRDEFYEDDPWWFDLAPAVLQLIEQFLDRPERAEPLSVRDVNVDSVDEFAELYGDAFTNFVHEAWER